MQRGDYFVIPMEDGRLAISQLIWLGSESEGHKFNNIFAFGVLSIGSDNNIPENNEYLMFKDHRGDFAVIFTSADKLKSGEWSILQAGPPHDSSLEELEFNMAGTLYRGGRPVRVLSFDEYQHHVLMGVSGYALVEKFLQQY